MGINARKMAETEVTVTVVWGEESADVVVTPGRITRQMIREFEGQVTMDTLVDQILVITKTWDVLDESGQPLPVTRDVAEMLPFGFLNDIMFQAVRSVGEQGKG